MPPPGGPERPLHRVVLATAGHIDHGKTELTKALTGIDTDRLPEEKARGITIDLGFAHLTLGGREHALIDVPGHERFVKNMLAGVGGIDLALVVVAADESVMPQTREHVAILDLLGVRAGVVALTKSDLAPPDVLELARLEVVELVAGTFLEGVPIVPVSARTGAGLDELRTALVSAAASSEGRDDRGPFRLHVDRVFTVKGFGSVVTGTVVSGGVRVGDDVEVSPLGETAKVRGIEVHGAAESEVRAGSRAALNLAGVDLAALERGQQLLPVGAFTPSTLIDVKLKLLGGSPPLKDLARVRFHLGALEALARVKLLDVNGTPLALAPGGEAYAQLRLERPLVAWPGDRFVLRSYSPSTTIGGGVVLDRPPRKHRGRGGEAAVASLRALESSAPDERLLRLVEQAGRRGASTTELAARTASSRADVEAALTRLEGIVRVAGSAPRSFSRAAWEALEREALEQMALFHRKEPLKDGMSREELRGRLFLDDAAVARHLLDELAATRRARLAGDLVALATHRVSLSGEQEACAARLVEAYRTSGLNPPLTATLLDGLGADAKRGEKLLPLLVRAGTLVAVPGGLYFHAEALAELRRMLLERIGPGKPFAVAAFKDLTGTSRKFAIPLLEYLDATRFTRRQGDTRVIVGAAPPAAAPAKAP